MKILLLFFCLLSCSCFGVDNLALALRFYKGNPYLANQEKSLFRQLDLAKQKHENNKTKLSLIYYLTGLVYDRKKDIDNAEINYLNSLKNNPLMIDAMIALMRIEKQMKKNNEYNENYKKVIESISSEIKNVEKDNFFDNHILSDAHFKYAVENALIPSIYNTGNNIMKMNRYNIKTSLKEALTELSKE